MRMNTWLNMAECVLWMARWKSFWTWEKIIRKGENRCDMHFWQSREQKHDTNFNSMHSKALTTHFPSHLVSSLCLPPPLQTVSALSPCAALFGLRFNHLPNKRLGVKLSLCHGFIWITLYATSWVSPLIALNSRNKSLCARSKSCSMLILQQQKERALLSLYFSVAFCSLLFCQCVSHRLLGAAAIREMRMNCMWAKLVHYAATSSRDEPVGLLYGRANNLGVIQLFTWL